MRYTVRLALASTSLLLAACANPGYYPNAQSPPPPPPAPQEAMTAQPSPAYVWVPGSYTWQASSRTYVWVPGHWTVPPSGQVWVPGHWETTATGNRWVEGAWRQG